ncbi:MAG: arginase family protein [Nanoarchaeota archaeon]|nr:arginase family protein [Nanoarchaeota archaeon]
MNILQVPTSQGSLEHNKGCELAPAAILKELRQQVPTTIVAVNQNDIDATQQAIYNAATQDCIILGGDHSITQAAFQAFAKRYKKPGLIMFDAHPDAMSNFKTTHEDFIHVLLAEGTLKPEHLVQIGIRAADIQEKQFLQKNNIKTYSPEQLVNIEYACDDIMEYLNTCDGIYITIDIDSLDPANAPGTGYLEPNGLTPRELFYLVKRFRKMKNYKMADIVEVNPTNDINNITVRTAAMLVKELL